MVSLYHRTLLDDFKLADISSKIEDAMIYVTKETESMDRPFRDALLNRLELRQLLLSAVQLDGYLDRQRARLWDGCLKLLPMLSQTSKLGVPLENSFSIKIQRKLASTVPPRPIVKISFDEAVARLSGICHDGRDAYQILDAKAGTRLMVCYSDFWRLTETCFDLSLDVRLDIPISKTTTFRVHTMRATVTDFQ